ncbi:D-alanine--D-alanine ligase family protein [Aureispira anguillae]|uniref:D-alanine--D-alanine ligase n=1 Tax=Aureispira anguillae TaxID=2864201 RepID=A0A915YHJ1_9BACT|nr:D-alanine--D-alanine ligase [Aureispira anguillae]BDS13170.1 D-alanine--D-alanine ligase [Aureispira anguillae]
MNEIKDTIMRIGIFFGGTSREREISFAGGRTVYDNLNKSLFTPVPIFVDSLGNFIRLDWQFLYKGTIRDFYPPVAYLPASKHSFQVYIESLEHLKEEELKALIEQVGSPVTIDELPNLIDFAFLALHGNLGEDGQIQGLLECLRIPYSGSGIRASSIGMDKSYQKKLMEAGGFNMPKMEIIKRAHWLKGYSNDWKEQLAKNIGLPMVVRPANQGSSIGVSIIYQIEDIEPAINAAFFVESIEASTWQLFSLDEKLDFLRTLTDIRTGIGFPLQITETQEVLYHPATLLRFLDDYFVEHAEVHLSGYNAEHTVVVEEFIHGREFSCVVIRGEHNEAIALPPTEILKGKEIFDYRSKYLAGLSRKLTPIDLPDEQIERIRTECEQLFDYLEFNTYARIDGFIQEDGKIFLNDPNTTSGMLPSSFFFHQAAEIGLNPSQFLTYIIRTSLIERLQTSTQLGWYEPLLKELDTNLQAQQQSLSNKQKIAIFLGGYSSERHISVESGRNIYEKLASSDLYEPIPIFVTGNSKAHQLYHIPINLLLKDNADDIRDKIAHHQVHPIITNIQQQCQDIMSRYTQAPPIFAPNLIDYDWLKAEVDGVFIALHGRPGEDGEVQQQLQHYNIPFNGSLASSAQITINKYDTLQLLKSHGLPVTDQLLIAKKEYADDPLATLQNIEKVLDYPFIAKPVDDGCSSAVKMIKTPHQLHAFLKALFRTTKQVDEEQATILGLKPKEEFPQKEVALLEALITQKQAAHFLEITGGLLTKYNATGDLEYEIFEPSEALATGEVLSLEEKFLAGEGQNITPARFVPAHLPFSHEHISKQVRATLQKAAQILKVTGYARIDAFVRIYEDGTAETLIIEVNSLPGMTPATCIFHQCAINGYKPYEFIHQILNFGKQRTKQITQV